MPWTPLTPYRTRSHTLTLSHTPSHSLTHKYSNSRLVRIPRRPHPISPRAHPHRPGRRPRPDLQCLGLKHSRVDCPHQGAHVPALLPADLEHVQDAGENYYYYYYCCCCCCYCYRTREGEEKREPRSNDDETKTPFRPSPQPHRTAPRRRLCNPRSRRSSPHTSPTPRS